MAISTHGLSHIALAVQDPERSVRFYAQVFGVKESWRDDESIEVVGPGPHDVIAFERAPFRAGTSGGVAHFGFRLTKASDIGLAVEAIEAAGGKLLERGQFGEGEPFIFFSDPDGYTVELWFEKGKAEAPPEPKKAKPAAAPVKKAKKRPR